MESSSWFHCCECFFLLYVYEKKQWGISYTKFMVVTSLFLTAFGLIGELMNPNQWTLINVAQIVIYTFVWLGFLSFPELKKRGKK